MRFDFSSFRLASISTLITSNVGEGVGHALPRAAGGNVCDYNPFWKVSQNFYGFALLTINLTFRKCPT